MSKEPDINELKSKVRFRIKIWIEFEKTSILGSGWADLLDHIENNEGGSLSQAAKECNYSYKYAWNILKRIEKRTGKSPVITGKGGSGGGGFIKLNEWGRYLLKFYKSLKAEIRNIEKKLNKTVKFT